VGVEGLGDRIRQAAEKVGGFNKLAQRINESAKTLGRYASGSDPKISTLIEIADATDTPLSMLIFGEPNAVTPDQLIWNVAYFLADKSAAVDADPKLFADTFLELVAFLSEGDDEELPEKVIDFAVRRLERAQA
jgi:transcriptional regulator with XRE-family HTH domain